MINSDEHKWIIEEYNDKDNVFRCSYRDYHILTALELLLNNIIHGMKNSEPAEEMLLNPTNQMLAEQCKLSKDDICSLANFIVYDLYDGQFPEIGNSVFSGPSMILFTQRMQIEKLYLDWCEEHDVANKPNSMVAFMQANDWLNEEQIMADLKLMDVFKKKKE